VDHHGLDEIDRRILDDDDRAVWRGPVGLSALAHSLGEEKGRSKISTSRSSSSRASADTERTRRLALAYRHLG